MKIFGGFILLGIATAMFVNCASAMPAVPVLHETDSDKTVEDDSDSMLFFISPVLRSITDGIPKYIQDLKEILGSENPIKRAIFKINVALKPDSKMENLDNLEILDEIPNSDNVLSSPDLNRIDILIGTDEAADIPKYSLDFTRVDKNQVSNIIPVTISPDENRPYEEVLDWALKTLGFADTDTDATIVDHPYGDIVVEDPVLHNENNPDFSINYGGVGNSNTIDEKSEETKSPSFGRRINFDDDLDALEPQYL